MAEEAQELKALIEEIRKRELSLSAKEKRLEKEEKDFIVLRNARLAEIELKLKNGEDILRRQQQACKMVQLNQLKSNDKKTEVRVDLQSLAKIQNLLNAQNKLKTSLGVKNQRLISLEDKIRKAETKAMALEKSLVESVEKQVSLAKLLEQSVKECSFLQEENIKLQMKQEKCAVKNSSNENELKSDKQLPLKVLPVTYAEVQARQNQHQYDEGKIQKIIQKFPVANKNMKVSTTLV